MLQPSAREPRARDYLAGNERAISTLEYALIAAMMAAVVGAAAQTMGTSLAGEYRVVATAVAPDSTPAQIAGHGGVSSD